ncbi:MAG: hypothetical protein QX196_16220 [Methylococcaceae bacterium]
MNSATRKKYPPPIVPTLRRGNAISDAPAARNAGALPDEFPLRNVTAIKLRRSLSGVEAIFLASAPLSQRFILPKGA